MANAKSHVLIDQDIHRAVVEDKQPRDAEHNVVEDGVITGKTMRKLYWHRHGKEGEVRSMPVEEWTGEAPSDPVEPLALPYPGAIVHVVTDPINLHVAAIVTATPYQEDYEVDLAAFDNTKTRVEWYKQIPNDETRIRVPSWHWPGTFFIPWISPHAIPANEQSPYEQGALADVPPQ